LAAIIFWGWRNSDAAFDWVNEEPPADTTTEVTATDSVPEAAVAKRASANLVQIFSTDDYPKDAIRRGEQGTVGYELSINRLGWVSGCRVVSSSGSEALDRATCNILRSRARFEPARDAAGRRVTDQYSGRIRWELPDE
jgi:protein TonB